MAVKLAKTRAKSESGRCPEGNRKVAQRSRGAAVMRRVRGSLGASKPAAELHILTDQALSICQKTLAGNRLPNAAMYEALFASPLIIDTALGLIPEDCTDPKVRAVRKALRRLELDFEDAEQGR